MTSAFTFHKLSTGPAVGTTESGFPSVREGGVEDQRLKKAAP